MMVSSSDFFAEYHGHRVAHLERLAAALRPRRLIFLAGDSTLDNKFWVLSSPPVPARNGVESALSPPVCAPDVACALNAELAAAAAAAAAAASPFACLNCAVEESTLRGRVAAGGALALAQDAFAARSLEAGDVLVISAGGNDVVLAPTLATAAAVAALLLFASEAALRDGSAWGMATLVALFRGEVERYARALCARSAPALLVICFVYYPQEGVTGSWADAALALMGYGRNPARLQRIMRAVYEHATRRVQLPGVQVVPLALFEHMDAGEASADYVARVEPSARGGEKIARAVLGAVLAAGVSRAAEVPRRSFAAVASGGV